MIIHMNTLFTSISAIRCPIQAFCAIQPFIEENTTLKTNNMLEIGMKFSHFY